MYTSQYRKYYNGALNVFVHKPANVRAENVRDHVCKKPALHSDDKETLHLQIFMASVNQLPPLMPTFCFAPSH